MEKELQEQLATATLIAPGNSEIIYRTGSASVIREDKIISIEGDINAVSEFLLKRYERKDADPVQGVKGKGTQFVDFEKSLVIVDKDADKPYILLQVDPQEHYGASIKAVLETSPELEIFDINNGHEYSREDLIKLFRFNKMHFAKPGAGLELERAFQKFSAKGYVDLVKEDDTRGNATHSITKKVETGLPLNFVLNIPIYKGQQKEEIEVDLCLDVNGTRVSFWFESVQLVELLQQRKDEIFAKELSACVDFPIIHK